MDRRKFISSIKYVLGSVVASNYLLSCSDDLLIDTKAINEEKKTLHRTLLHYIQNGKDVGYFELYPHIFRQPRTLIIANDYYFIEDKIKEEYFFADTMIRVELLAIVRFNFDFYKTKIKLKNLYPLYENTRNDARSRNDEVYQITTENPEQSIRFKPFSNLRNIDYPIRVLPTECGLGLDPNFALPCIMSKESFGEYVIGYEKINF